MAEVWVALFPLIVGSAAVPVQIVVTLLLLRAPSGQSTAVAFVAGLTVVRMAQGIVFGLILSAAGAEAIAARSAQPGRGMSMLLLVISIMFLVTALRELFYRQETDVPPKWLAVVESITPLRAFLLGVVWLAVGAKFWVFTLGAIGAITEAGLGQPVAALTFVLFVMLAQSPHLAILAVALGAPQRSDAVLGRTMAWLRRYDSAIVVVIGFVFAAWFLVRALRGFGVL